MPKVPPPDDTAETPVFVGAVFKNYSDIGRAVSFALAHSDHVDIAPATPQRGTRKLGLEGPKPRLALPHPAQFANGKANGNGNGPQQVLAVLTNGPLTRSEIGAALPDLPATSIAYALSVLKERKQILHGSAKGDPYSINPEAPPVASNRTGKHHMQSDDTIESVARMIISKSGGGISFSEIRKQTPRRFKDKQLHQALWRLASKKQVTTSGPRGHQHYSLAEAS